jgi:hypothetical protein
MQIKSIGIDLGKTTFHLIALGSRSQIVIRKKFSRSQLLEYTANLPSSLIGMEAGVGSHFLGRALREQGHKVRLIPAQFVRPFVKSNKNDYRDAEAIAEAVERENMRFVPISMNVKYWRYNFAAENHGFASSCLPSSDRCKRRVGTIPVQRGRTIPVDNFCNQEIQRATCGSIRQQRPCLAGRWYHSREACWFIRKTSRTKGSSQSIASRSG